MMCVGESIAGVSEIYECVSGIFPGAASELVTEQILVRERDYYCTIMAAFWSPAMNETLKQDTFRF